MTTPTQPWGWDWLVHHRLTFVAVGLPTHLAGTLLGVPELGWLGIALLVLFCVAGPAERRHDPVRCPTCRAGLRADGATEAARLDPALRVWHWIDDHPGLMLLALVVVFAADFAVHGFVYLGYAMWIAEIRVGRTHRLLRPWCPHCRDDDGDWCCTDTPDPVPAGRKDKQP